MFWVILIGLSCFKCLLIPSYVSTDFEVHRNWLATTYNLPLCKWYSANHSEWTLDYPPLFAWFEYSLSQVAYYFDPEMLKIENINYKSENTILFQRLSVIIADLMYAYGVNECGNYLSNSHLRKSSKWHTQWNSPSTILVILFATSASLLLVDHIHFQYNGFLLGILLLSIVRILQGRKLEGAIWFSILLNLKHIFIYVAPAYFIYLLRNYCFSGGIVNKYTFHCRNFIQLALSVCSVFLISFGPFILCGQFFQVLTRLFPFKRGLCHAYWAPNFWALYNAFDKLLTLIGRWFGFHGDTSVTASMTGGLVQHFEHSVLPTITPCYTFIITLLAITPCMYKLWTDPENPLHFMRSIILCAFTSFLFGWHVHEKAILLCVIPLTFMSVIRRNEASIYLLLSTISHYSIFPLLFQPFEVPIKLLVTLIHSTYAFSNLSQLFNIRHDKLSLPLLSRIESIYIFSLFPLFLYENIFHYLLGFHKKLPFLPLMLTSVHNSIGVIYCYINYYHYFLSLTDSDHKRKAF